MQIRFHTFKGLFKYAPREKTSLLAIIGVVLFWRYVDDIDFLIHNITHNSKTAEVIINALGGVIIPALFYAFKEKDHDNSQQ